MECMDNEKPYHIDVVDTDSGEVVFRSTTFYLAKDDVSFLLKSLRNPIGQELYDQVGDRFVFEEGMDVWPDLIAE